MSKRVTLILYAVLAGLLVLVVVLVLANRGRPPDERERRAESRVPVRIEPAQVRDLPDVLTLSGRVDPWRAARLASARAGTVTALAVDKGSAVTAGQVLAAVDARVWAAAVARTRAEQEDADRQLGRLSALRDEGAVSSNDVDIAQARADMAHAALREAEAFLAQCSVEAPFDGIVNHRHVELGDFVPEGGAIFDLIDLARVKVLVDVPERDVAALATDMPMTFTLAALGGETLTGRVSFVAAAASRGGNAFRVELAVDNAAGRLRPGMLADVEVPRGLHQDRVVLPLAAVLPLKGEHVVFVVSEGHALRRLVTIAALVGQDAVLERGVDAGEWVVVEGQRSLADGVPVEVRGDVEAPAAGD